MWDDLSREKEEKCRMQNAECRVKASPVGGDIPGDPKTNEYRAQKKKLKKFIFFVFYVMSIGDFPFITM